MQSIESAMRGDVSYFLTMPVKSFHDVIRAVEVAVEKETTKERLVQDRYYVTVGKLAAGVAHSIKNSLWNIGSRAQILLAETDKNDKSYALLETIKRRCDDANKVVVDLLNFSRKRERSEKNEIINIVEIIQDVLRLIDLELKFFKIELQFNNDANDVKILGDEFLLKEAFLNLVKNAIEAMPDGGKLSIELANIEKYITIKISDTGSGMSPEILENMFIPFYTTKKDSVGFGLFETQRIIKKHNGTIKVESEEKKGSTFTIELPLYSSR
jgi:signal transduction histidine kinase